MNAAHARAADAAGGVISERPARLIAVPCDAVIVSPRPILQLPQLRGIARHKRLTGRQTDHYSAIQAAFNPGIFEALFTWLACDIRGICLLSRADEYNADKDQMSSAVLRRLLSMP
jgi:hypothetical protein